MHSGEGLVCFSSGRTVDETVVRLQAALESRGVKVFAVIDHGGEAEKAGLSMRPTQVIVFGSPKAGTPLMVAAPSLAIDLPLKALVAERDDGSVWVTLNDPAYLQARHGFAKEMIGNLAGAVSLVEKALGGADS